jgi:predicted nuclease of predicted toxin-antitoxin system
VIVTHDSDFLRLAARYPDHPGVAYCHLLDRSIGEIVRSLILIFEILDSKDLVGRVEYL